MQGKLVLNVFTIKRVVRRKKQFDENVGEDANESQSLEEKFKVTYFYHIIDQALTSKVIKIGILS